MANMFMTPAARRMIAGATGEVDWIVDTIKAILLGSGYTPNADHEFLSDVTPGTNRITGTTDQTLAGKAIGQDLTGDFGYVDADDVPFTAVPAGAAAEWVGYYKSTGSDATSPLLFVLDINVTPNGGNITVQHATPANGGVAKLLAGNPP